MLGSVALPYLGVGRRAGPLEEAWPVADVALELHWRAAYTVEELFSSLRARSALRHIALVLMRAMRVWAVRPALTAGKAGGAVVPASAALPSFGGSQAGGSATPHARLEQGRGVAGPPRRPPKLHKTALKVIRSLTDILYRLHPLCGEANGLQAGPVGSGGVLRRGATDWTKTRAPIPWSLLLGGCPSHLRHPLRLAFHLHWFVCLCL